MLYCINMLYVSNYITLHITFILIFHYIICIYPFRSWAPAFSMLSVSRWWAWSGKCLLAPYTRSASAAALPATAGSGAAMPHRHQGSFLQKCNFCWSCASMRARAASKSAATMAHCLSLSVHLRSASPPSSHSGLYTRSAEARPLLCPSPTPKSVCQPCGTLLPAALALGVWGDEPWSACGAQLARRKAPPHDRRSLRPTIQHARRCCRQLRPCAGKPRRAHRGPLLSPVALRSRRRRPHRRRQLLSAPSGIGRLASNPAAAATPREAPGRTGACGASACRTNVGSPCRSPSAAWRRVCQERTSGWGGHAEACALRASRSPSTARGSEPNAKAVHAPPPASWRLCAASQERASRSAEGMMTPTAGLALLPFTWQARDIIQPPFVGLDFLQDEPTRQQWRQVGIVKVCETSLYVPRSRCHGDNGLAELPAALQRAGCHEQGTQKSAHFVRQTGLLQTKGHGDECVQLHAAVYLPGKLHHSLAHSSLTCSLVKKSVEKTQKIAQMFLMDEVHLAQKPIVTPVRRAVPPETHSCVFKRTLPTSRKQHRHIHRKLCLTKWLASWYICTFLYIYIYIYTCIYIYIYTYIHTYPGKRASFSMLCMTSLSAGVVTASMAAWRGSITSLRSFDVIPWIATIAESKIALVYWSLFPTDSNCQGSTLARDGFKAKKQSTSHCTIGSRASRHSSLNCSPHVRDFWESCRSSWATCWKDSGSNKPSAMEKNSQPHMQAWNPANPIGAFLERKTTSSGPPASQKAQVLPIAGAHQLSQTRRQQQPVQAIQTWPDSPADASAQDITDCVHRCRVRCREADVVK